MKIEDYTRLREYRYYRRATFWTLLLDAVLIGLLGAIAWLTCTTFLDTTLSEGIRRLAETIGGK